MITVAEIKRAIEELTTKQQAQPRDWMDTHLPKMQETRGENGLPVIRAKDAPITSALVREIEGLAA